MTINLVVAGPAFITATAAAGVTFQSFDVPNNGGSVERGTPDS